MPARSPMYATEAEVEAVLSACRVLVAVASRSHAAGHVVDPVQFRLLVTISAGAGLPLGELAEAVGVNASTASRAYDQLVRAGFIDVDGRSTRHQRLRLTQTGRDLVKAEVGRRREALELILGRMSADRRLEFVAVLREFVVTVSNDPTLPIANESRLHGTMNGSSSARHAHSIASTPV
jgi:DNA-binding MarR family transcriptional regulator